MVLNFFCFFILLGMIAIRLTSLFFTIKPLLKVYHCTPTEGVSYRAYGDLKKVNYCFYA